LFFCVLALRRPKFYTFTVSANLVQSAVDALDELLALATFELLLQEGLARRLISIAQDVVQSQPRLERWVRH
jgi:hypothetical protein